MKMDLNTPALLFSITSLLMLAYTNRFLGIARLIRELHDKYVNKADEHILKQIKNLRMRLMLIRNAADRCTQPVFKCGMHVFYLFRTGYGSACYFWHQHGNDGIFTGAKRMGNYHICRSPENRTAGY